VICSIERALLAFAITDPLPECAGGVDGGSANPGRSEMHAVAISLISIVCALAGISWSHTSSAQSASQFFQTTFNCIEWTTPTGTLDRDVCTTGDGISGHGGWSTANGSYDQITTAANNPGGGGGRGFRHWRGNGHNSNGGGLIISLAAPVTEMWVRFYMRYSLGFAWSNGQPNYVKDHYWQPTGQYVIFGIYGSAPDGGHSWGIYSLAVDRPYGSNISWSASQGGSTGDGQWHCYEYHLKKVNGVNDVFELWFDGVQYANTTNANLGTTPWQSFILGSNQDFVASKSDQYTDYDDLAISTSGRIGCIGATAFPVPQNLRVR
jgi:hypothetical protein